MLCHKVSKPTLVRWLVKTVCKNKFYFILFWIHSTCKWLLVNDTTSPQNHKHTVITLAQIPLRIQLFGVHSQPQILNQAKFPRFLTYLTVKLWSNQGSFQSNFASLHSDWVFLIFFRNIFKKCQILAHFWPKLTQKWLIFKFS